MSLAAPKSVGGYLIEHITLHADLFLLKSAMKYIKCNVNDDVMRPELYFVEYHLGIQLSCLYGLKLNNRTPHTDRPSEIYSYILKLIRQYNITLDELAKGSINMIYKRIIGSY